MSRRVLLLQGLSRIAVGNLTLWPWIVTNSVRRIARAAHHSPPPTHVGVQVWLWLIAQFGTLAVIVSTDPSVRNTLRRLIVHGSGSAYTRALWETGKFAICAACTVALYSWLYASDPGFLRSDAQGPWHVQTRTAGQAPCPHCGCRPSLRCKHSKLSGQCVHKFDHSCWFLSTDIGDRTHGAFTLYMALQCAWMLWALLKLGPVATGCLFRPKLWECKHASVVQFVLAWAALLWTLCALVPIAYLFVLHTYLLITNQTTYEVLKGPAAGYMLQHYSGHRGKGYDLPLGLCRLLWDEMRRRGPPKPFSRGVLRNLAMLATQRWPREFEPAAPAAELMSLV
jgi:DHHC palmitoyltransferase